jgi:hypothetical protein
MKIKISVFILGLILMMPMVALKAQLIKVPAEVKQAFEAKFPGAKEVDWTNNFGDPEVTFVHDGKNCKAQFNSKGEWKKTETKTSYDALPDEVKEGYNKSKYAQKWKVNSAYRIENPKEIYYRVNIYKSDVQLKNLYFNEKGQLLKDPITL